MIKDYVDLKRNEKFERKIIIACDFHSAKYEFTRGKIFNANKFAAYDFYDIEDYYTNPLLFKIIKVNPKSCVENKKVYGLVLLECTNLLKQCENT